MRMVGGWKRLRAVSCVEIFGLYCTSRQSTLAFKKNHEIIVTNRLHGSTVLEKLIVAQLVKKLPTF
jgi:hypothetical protein